MATMNFMASGLPGLLHPANFDLNGGKPGVFPASWGAPIGVSLSLLAGSGILSGLFQDAATPQWGIYNAATFEPLGDPGLISSATGSLFGAVKNAAIGLLTGQSAPVISTRSVEYGKEFRVSSFPIERGTFADYNKVEFPAEPRVTLAMAGVESDRRDFLAKLDAAAKSLDLYNVVTPERTYINHAISRYNYQRRSSRGAGMIVVELILSEIREVWPQYGEAQVQKPQNAAAEPPQDSGATQPRTPGGSASPLADISNDAKAGGGTVDGFISGLKDKSAELIRQLMGQNKSLADPQPGIGKK